MKIFVVLATLSFMAPAAQAEDFQRETSPEELAVALNTMPPAKPFQIHSVILQGFDKMQSLCRYYDANAETARAVIKQNNAKIKTLEEVYPRMAKVVEGRETKTFLKHYFAEELAVRTENAKKILNVVEGDGHMQLMDMLGLLIYQARQIEKNDATNSSEWSRREVTKLNSRHCGMDSFADTVQIDGTKKKNRTELENSSRQILRLAILPEAAKNTPVFCSEQLLQAQINFDALSNEEFVAHGLDVLAAQHAKRVTQIMASPKLIGRIVFDTAKRVDVKQGDVLHARTYAAHRKTVDRFVAVAVENIESVMEINRLQDTQANMQVVIDGANETQSDYGTQFRLLAKALNPDHEVSPNFKPCAK